MPNKKEHTISFRITEEDKQILDVLKSKGFHISEYLREAFRNYFLMFYLNPRIGNPQMVFSKNLVSQTFKFLSDQEIEETAKIAYNNSLQSMKDISELMDVETLQKLIPSDSFTSFLKTSGETVYSSTGQNWLDEFTYHEKGNLTIIGASHNLGEQFSLFFKSLLIKHASQFGYHLQSSKFFDKESNGEEKTKQNHIALQFMKRIKEL